MRDVYAELTLLTLVILIILYETYYKKSGSAVTFTLLDEEGKDLTTMSTPITVDRQRIATIDPSSIKDSKGRPAKIDGNPVYALSEEGNFSLFPSEDGFSCAVLGVSPTADGQVIVLSVSIDADLSAETKFVTKTAELTCTPAQAADFGLVLGEESDPA
ncbi:MAG: hypothetical protein ACREJN_21565 [Nitrospiraceae bacterium]